MQKFISCVMINLVIQCVSSCKFVLHFKKRSFCSEAGEHYGKYEFKASNFNRHYNCVIKYIVVKILLLQFFFLLRLSTKDTYSKNFFQMTDILNKDKLIACRRREVKEHKNLSFCR